MFRSFLIVLFFCCGLSAQLFIPMAFWKSQVPWTPKELGAYLLAWYDSDNEESVRTGVAGISQATSGDPVSMWMDLSTHDYHLEQTIAARQPVYDASGFGVSMPAITWDASDDSLLTSAITWQNYTIAAVVRHSSISNVRAIITKRAAVSAGFFWFTWNSTANTINWDQNGNRLNTTFLPVTATDYIYILVRPSTGSNRIKYVNGTQIISSATNPDNSNTETLFLGNEYSSANRGLDGKITELVIVSTNLDDTSREKLEGYLAWKWGVTGSLPIAHPYKTIPP